MSHITRHTSHVTRHTLVPAFEIFFHRVQQSLPYLQQPVTSELADARCSDEVQCMAEGIGMQGIEMQEGKEGNAAEKRIENAQGGKGAADVGISESAQDFASPDKPVRSTPGGNEWGLLEDGCDDDGNNRDGDGAGDGDGNLEDGKGIQKLPLRKRRQRA